MAGTESGATFERLLGMIADGGLREPSDVAGRAGPDALSAPSTRGRFLRKAVVLEAKAKLARDAQLRRIRAKLHRT